jgi:hypothetical protein
LLLLGGVRYIPKQFRVISEELDCTPRRSPVLTAMDRFLDPVDGKQSDKFILRIKRF